MSRKVTPYLTELFVFITVPNTEWNMMGKSGLGMWNQFLNLQTLSGIRKTHMYGSF